jgi:hypothetical protein
MSTKALLGLACAGMLSCASRPEPTPFVFVDAHERAVQHPILALDPGRELVIGWEALADEAVVQAQLDRVYSHIEARSFKLAVVEIEGLLRLDLPRFGPLLSSDLRFELLRSSAYADELERVHTEVAIAYREALQQGVSAWVGRPSCSITGPEALRQGVWVPKFARFIPLSPVLPHAVGGLLDVNRGRLLMISAVFAPSRTHARAPVELGFHVYDLDALGVPIHAVEDLAKRRPELGGSRRGIHAALVGDDVHLTLLDFEGDGELHVMVELGVPRVLARTRSQHEEHTSARLRHQVDVNGPHIAIDGDAVALHPPTLTRPRVVGELLHTDEDDKYGIAFGDISPPHHIPEAQHIEEAPDGGHALLLSHYTRQFEGDTPRPLFYAVSRVHFHCVHEIGEELLAEGPGWTWASLGGDGSVYFETWEGRLWRYPPSSRSPVWDLPEWVQIEPPCWRAPQNLVGSVPNTQSQKGVETPKY